MKCRKSRFNARKMRGFMRPTQKNAHRIFKSEVRSVRGMAAETEWEGQASPGRSRFN